MSKVEVKVRFLKEKTKEQLLEEAEEIKVQKLIQGDDYIAETESEDKYAYEKGILDLKDVAFANYVDPEHVCIRLHTGNTFVIKINYDNYVDVYQRLTGYVITLLYDEEIVNQ